MKLFLLGISFIACNLFAQENLIYNGSFEEYTLCPDANNLPGNYQFERCKGWWSAFMTPDYVNACYTGPNVNFVGVPSNMWGYQEAYDGNAYVGFTPYDWSVYTADFVGAEFFQTRLLQEVKPCVQYRIRFYISLANVSKYNTQSLSIGFSNDSVFMYEAGTNAHYPPFDEVIHFKVPLGTDTVSWYQCDTAFSVSKTYEYLIIGDFKQSLGDTVFVQFTQAFPGEEYAYFLLDSISLYQVEELEDCQYESVEVPNVFTPNNDQVNDFIDFSGFDKVIIMGRWGNTILIMDKQSNFEWHGKNWQEEDVPAGVYYYVGRRGEQEQKGSIQLIR